MSDDFQLGAEFARGLDARDPLARFRDRFATRPGRVYLQASGLGLLSGEAEQAVRDALADWKERAHRGWEEGERPWLTTAERLGALEAPLIGAAPDEVVATVVGEEYVARLQCGGLNAAKVAHPFGTGQDWTVSTLNVTVNTKYIYR